MVDITGMKITPISPHSDYRVLSAYNSLGYRYFRTVKFDPNSCTGIATLKTILQQGWEVGKSPTDLKLIEAAEQTASQTYVPALMSLLSQLTTNENVHRECPTVLQTMVSGTNYVLTIDDYETIKDEINKMNLLSIPGIEDLVSQLTGAHLVIEDPDPIREFPGSELYFFCPFMTLASMRTLLNTLKSNEHLARSYFQKLKIPTTMLDAQAYVKKQGPRFNTWDWQNPHFQFWILNCWVWNKNATVDIYIWQTQSGQAMVTDTAQASWLQYFHYIYPQGGSPNSLNNIIRLLYPYGAVKNVIGCCEVFETAENMRTAAAMADDNLSFVWLAVNGTQFAWVGHSSAEPIMSTLLPMVMNNSTQAMTRVIDAQPSTVSLTLPSILPSNMKWKLFGSESGYWDITNYNAEHAFFSNLFKGGAATKKSPFNKKEKAKPFTGK